MNIATVKNIIILGCGGSGSAIIPFISRFLSSLDNFDGTLILVDGDSYSEDNSERQVFDVRYVGTNKAEYQFQKLRDELPSMMDKIAYVDKYLGKDDIDELVVENTIVINCVDNKAARKYVEDKILTLNNAAHICCGNEEYIGQVQISYRFNGIQVTPSIYEAVPAFNSDDDDRSELSCEELAALPGGGQIVCANLMAASIALNYFVRLVSDNPMFLGGIFMPNSGTFFNILTGSFDLVDKKTPNLNMIMAFKENQLVKK